MKKLGIGCLGVIAFVILLVVIGTIASSNSESPEVVQDTRVEEEEKTEIEYIEVDMKDFLAEYDKNQLSAEKKWTGKNIQTRGYVSNISESFAGSYYIVLEYAEDTFLDNTIHCRPEAETDWILDLENETWVTVRGEVQDMSMMSVALEDCQLVE